MWPGVCPGVNSTRSCRPPTSTRSPSVRVFGDVLLVGLAVALAGEDGRLDEGEHGVDAGPVVAMAMRDDNGLHVEAFEGGLDRLAAFRRVDDHGVAASDYRRARSSCWKQSPWGRPSPAEPAVDHGFDLPRRTSDVSAVCRGVYILARPQNRSSWGSWKAVGVTEDLTPSTAVGTPLRLTGRGDALYEIFVGALSASPLLSAPAGVDVRRHGHLVG